MTDCCVKERLFKFYTYNHLGRDCEIFIFAQSTHAAWAKFRKIYPQNPVDFLFEIVQGKEQAVELISGPVPPDHIDPLARE